MFGLLGWQARLIEIVVCGLLALAAYHYIGQRAVNQYKTEQAILQAKADAEQTAKYNKVANELEELKTKRQENAKVIQKETERVITNQPIIYANDCVSKEGFDIINRALDGKAQKP